MCVTPVASERFILGYIPRFHTQGYIEFHAYEAKSRSYMLPCRATPTCIYAYMRVCVCACAYVCVCVCVSMCAVPDQCAHRRGPRGC